MINCYSSSEINNSYASIAGKHGAKIAKIHFNSVKSTKKRICHRL